MTNPMSDRCPVVRLSQSQWFGGASGSESQLHTHSLRVERKHFTFDLSENPRGRFLRIIEEVGGCHDIIIIPLTGLEDFRDQLNEVIKFSQTLSLKT
jgi:hypothetical protein